MKKKGYRLLFAGISFYCCFILSSCKPSLFDVLTHGDIGYWKRTNYKGVLSFSKNDSIREILNGDLTPDYWYKRQKVKVCENSIYYSTINDNGTCNYICDGIDLVLSYSRNKITLVSMGGDFNNIDNTIKWRRIKNKEAKHRTDGAYIEADSLEDNIIVLYFNHPDYINIKKKAE